MALTKSNYVERVLMVFNQEGNVTGAHAERIELVRDGETMLSARMLPAEPVAPSMLSSVLPDQGALLAQAASLQAALDAMTARATEAEKRVAELEASRSQEPAGCTDFQGRMALKAAGKLMDAENLVASLPIDDERRIYWERSLFWREDSPIIAQFAVALSISDEQKSELFAFARTIQP